MRILYSGWLLKLLVGAAIVIAAVGIYDTPSQDVSCTTISSVPYRSSVYECKAGLSSVFFRNTTKIPVFATMTSDQQAEAWLTRNGVSYTAKTIRRLGPSVVLGGDAILAVSTPAQGSVLAYVLSKTTVLLTVVWDVQTTK